jgi:peptidase M23-like protein
MKNRGAKSRALVTCGVLATGLLAGTGCGPAEEATQAEQPESAAAKAGLGAVHVEGPQRISNPHNDVVLELPKGWYAVVPTELASGGPITLVDYDSRIQTGDPAHYMSPERVKVDIIAVPLEGKTVTQWAQARMEASRSSGAQMQALAADSLNPLVYELARREGVAYRMMQGMDVALEMAVPWGQDKVLSVSILPATSVTLEEALPILDAMRTRAEEQASLGTIQGRDKAVLAAPLQPLRLPMQSMAAAPCTQWFGSDSGSIAANTPIALNVPFSWGTYWMAGGVGSFWGNYYHGNCNNDYYAVDFNLSNSSCGGATNSTGQPVYAAAGGTAYKKSTSDGTGYGTYVEIVHGTTGVTTIYAHLSGYGNFTSGTGVTDQTVIGYVGQSGSAGGNSHLHFTMRKSGSSRCKPASGNCPNGESPSTVQSPKPSPMNTNVGSRALYDGGCFPAPP